MQRENKCNNPEPHSHLVAGRTFECEKGVKQTMEERFDERFTEFDVENNSSSDNLAMLKEIKSFIKSEIDTARTEERQRCLEALPPERIIHEYMPSQNTPENNAWNEYRNQAIKNITKIRYEGTK